MELKDVIQGLVDSADNSGCSDGLTVVDEKWIDMLEEYIISQKNKGNEPVFEYTCGWELSTKYVYLSTFENNPKDINIYGFNIYDALKKAQIGDVVKWEEPFSGWVKVKRIS